MYFTTIEKQVIQLILIYFLGTDVITNGSTSLMVEEAGVLGENPHFKAGNQQVTTIPFHIKPILITGIELGSQR